MPTQCSLGYACRVELFVSLLLRATHCISGRVAGFLRPVVSSTDRAGLALLELAIVVIRGGTLSDGFLTSAVCVSKAAIRAKFKSCW